MKAERLSLHYVYYALAAFVVATVSVSLYMTHELVSSFSTSVHVNESWANTLSQISSLGELAAKVNAPGNDVFDSHDVPAESKRMRAARAEFDRALVNLRGEFRANDLGDRAEAISKQLDLTAQAMDEMTAEAGRIFQYFDSGQPALAGSRMATMDRKYAELHTGLSRMRASVVEIQTAVFAREQEQVQSIRSLENYVAIAVLLLVAGVTVYGHWVSQHNERSRQIELARDKAVESARLKSEFLANMSHEIRTPLNGVIGMTALLLDSELTDEQRECTETAHSSGVALLSIVNDILDFSKIEAGKLSIENHAFDLRQLAEDAVELLSPSAAEKQLELMLSYPNGLPRRFVGDGDRIRQVLLNLIGNALKFTHSGHVLIDVTMVDKAIRVAVVDTGIGIPQDRIDSLFEQFTQADASTTRRYGGTGLGLSISKSLIELMNGSIKVESTEGVGSKFTVTLPLPVFQDSGPPPRRTGELAGLRVLVVDDHPISRRILHDQLAAAGMQIETYGSGKDALAGFETAMTAGAPFGVVVTDYQMPGLNGATLAGQIREIAPDVGIVLLDSVGHRSEPNSPRPDLIDACLSKPARGDRLVETVSALWKQRSESGGLLPQAATAADLTYDSPSEAEVRVLLAEDNLVNQKLARLQLAKLNLRVDIVANGREAVEQVQQAPYAFVLMDCAMPEMNGYDATAAIRNLDSAVSQIPIIAMTANAIVGSKERCFAAGMNDFLSKPVTPKELKAVVERWRPARQPVAG